MNSQNLMKYGQICFLKLNKINFTRKSRTETLCVEDLMAFIPNVIDKQTKKCNSHVTFLYNNLSLEKIH